MIRGFVLDANDLDCKLGEDNCVRFYNEKQEHVLTLVVCFDDPRCFDLATPDGKVIYCGQVPVGVVNTLVEVLGAGSI